MKSINKIALILALLMTLVFPTVAFGEDLDGETNNTTDETQVSSEVDQDADVETDEDIEDEEVVEEGNGKGKGNSKVWKEAKAAVEAEKDDIEALKDGIEDELEALETSLEAAEALGDEAAIADIKLQLEAKKLEMNEYKVQMKVKIQEMQEIVRNKYTQEELEALQEVSLRFDSIENVEVIPVENVLFKKGNAKFDTPPVIKEGRTLIPVRAVSEALGAKVEYDDVEKIVTITKDEKVVVFSLTEGTVTVNEETVEIDVPAEVMNNRTMVPLRFIAEQLELSVEWDQETQTINID
ncbi:stalk domain-containing protein [Sedimentibacter saalensis]|uniref:stalk domain-containing protein n=1 Tax=Sedimentibacter saalensis TaxID=130788 RepID=UPI00289DCCD1|nr:stalk domain-containing protein [Sedimentibacter saalensis]